MKWAGVDLNHRHTDFQSVALPTELPARKAANLAENSDIARKLAPNYTFTKLVFERILLTCETLL